MSYSEALALSVARFSVILEVDDELERSILKSRHFEELRAGHETAESPGEARSKLSSIARNAPGGSLVIVLDLMFREEYEAKEGLDFIRELRAGKLGVHPQTPVVVLSNAKSPQMMESAFAVGANEFFSKSDNPGDVVKKLKFYLGGKVVENEHLCEVVDLDLDSGNVRVRLRAGEQWILERWMPLSFCPPASRVVGAAFLWETVAEFRDYRVRYAVQGCPLEGTRTFGQLLHPEW